MNEHEIERIADAMNRLRPDWPTKQLRTLLSDARVSGRPRRDVTVALAWVACESGSATPYRVLEAGPWWKASAVEGALVRRHTRAEDSCRRCGGELPDCCDAPTRERPKTNNADHAARARAALTTAARAAQPQEENTHG